VLFAGDGAGLGPALREVARPEVALVSPAARTVATADLVLADVAAPPERRFDEELYGADPEEIVALLRDLPESVTAAMVVGHNPTAQSLSLGLLGAREKKARSLVVRTGFPTCALGVYAFKTDRWADVAAGTAKLVAIMAPPYGD